VSDEPIAWDNAKYICRHKIELMKIALDDFDEIVWVDWDCVQTRKIPANFWLRMSSGQPFKACLKRQKKPNCWWRSDRESMRFLPCTAVTYVRGKDTIKHVVDCWTETKMHANDEIAFAKMSDNLLGGWKGPEVYCSNFDPFCATTHRCQWITPDFLAKKEVILHHLS
jgi:hypothetical protein